MTPQEAKQRLERIWKDYTSAYDTASIEDLMAFDMATNAVGAIEQIQWERDLAIKQLHDLGYGLGEKPREEAKKSNDLIERQAAIDAVWNGMCIFYDCDVIRNLKALPSAQPEFAQQLYQYKCYITDKEGLQHEVVHTGDIRRITGWEI